MAAVKCGCVRALARAGAPSDLPHIDLCPLTSAVNLVLFLPFLHGLSKPLTTYLCVVLCASCWKPGSCWPPVKEDPLHHGSDTLTVPLSLSEEAPLLPLPSARAPQHTQLLNHTHISLVAVKGQTQWRGADWLTFLSVTGARSARLLNPQFLTQFPHPSRAKQTTQFSFSLTLIHAHTLSLRQPTL